MVMNIINDNQDNRRKAPLYKNRKIYEKKFQTETSFPRALVKTITQFAQERQITENLERGTNLCICLNMISPK